MVLEFNSMLKEFMKRHREQREQGPSPRQQYLRNLGHPPPFEEFPNRLIQGELFDSPQLLLQQLANLNTDRELLPGLSPHGERRKRLLAENTLRRRREAERIERERQRELTRAAEEARQREEAEREQVRQATARAKAAKNEAR
eukprot:COSAG02_NODE_8471_length_2561_cov_4.772949_3_plen_143_part_00